MLIKDSKYDARYKVNPINDDGGPITFRWHFPRGMLSKRMSGLELAIFVLNHMRAIIGMGLLSGHKRVQDEFEAMFVKLATSPQEAIDRILSWIRVEWHEQDSDIIHMSLFDQTSQLEYKPHFIMPGVEING